MSGTPGALLSKLVTLVSPLGEKGLCDEGLNHFTITNPHLTIMKIQEAVIPVIGPFNGFLGALDL